MKNCMVVLEVTGQRRSEKAEKIATVRDLWVPAVNNLGEFGRWIFVEITDPNETQALLRSSLAGASQVSA